MLIVSYWSSWKWAKLAQSQLMRAAGYVFSGESMWIKILENHLILVAGNIPAFGRAIGDVGSFWAGPIHPGHWPSLSHLRADRQRRVGVTKWLKVAEVKLLLENVNPLEMLEMFAACGVLCCGVSDGFRPLENVKSLKCGKVPVRWQWHLRQLQAQRVRGVEGRLENAIDFRPKRPVSLIHHPAIRPFLVVWT